MYHFRERRNNIQQQNFVVIVTTKLSLDSNLHQNNAAISVFLEHLRHGYSFGNSASQTFKNAIYNNMKNFDFKIWAVH